MRRTVGYLAMLALAALSANAQEDPPFTGGPAELPARFGVIPARQR